MRERFARRLKPRQESPYAQSHAEDDTRLEDTTRTELIDGEYVVSPNPGLRRQRIIGRLHVAFFMQVQDAGDGEAILSPFAATLSRFTVFQPNLLVLKSEPQARLSERGTEGAPDLALDVLSPETRGRDRTGKRRTYLKHGAREYRIVDGKANTVQVLRPAEIFAGP